MTTLPAHRLSIALLVLASACWPFKKSAPVRTPPRAAAPAPAPAPAPARAASVAPARSVPKNAPTDAEIAGILLAANNTDISYAKLAPSRAQSQRIKAYADSMLKDHAGANELVMGWVSAAKVSPVESKTSLGFRDESTARRSILRELKGVAFDSIYIENEVGHHTRLLASIDKLLAPSARNAQLRKLLAEFRPAVAAHLEQAEQLRAGLVAAR